eukprot:4872083-Prymnesium_polylepis.1
MRHECTHIYLNHCEYTQYLRHKHFTSPVRGTREGARRDEGDQVPSAMNENMAAAQGDGAEPLALVAPTAAVSTRLTAKLHLPTAL